ncbi:MAG: hypothetical protein OXQ90_05315 [Gammaproteobacteria bacterium]|nr:hypothetical protein [Gammaproteobacteria bacterium]
MAFGGRITRPSHRVVIRGLREVAGSNFAPIVRDAVRAPGSYEDTLRRNTPKDKGTMARSVATRIVNPNLVQLYWRDRQNFPGKHRNVVRRSDPMGRTIRNLGARSAFEASVNRSLQEHLDRISRRR